MGAGCDTCDSKKTTSLLEGAHAHTRMRREWGRRLRILGEGAQGNLSLGLSSL